MKIFFAVDGSEHTWAAVDLLKSLPLSASQITLLAVADAGQTPRSLMLQQALDQAFEKLRSTATEIRRELLYGHPAQEIVRYSEVYKPDLIVMGAKGLRATLGILLGGVAQQVVEHADFPVLITRAPYLGMQRVLIAIDGSPCSQNALEYLIRFPLPSDTQIYLMHVLPPPASEQEILTATWAAGVDALSIRPTIREELERAQREEEQRCETLVAQALEKLEALNRNVSSVVRRGDAATEILAYARENDINLIVAGSRGLSAISGWLLGSVSRKIVHYAGCSVLIVKGA